MPRLSKEAKKIKAAIQSQMKELKPFLPNGYAKKVLTQIDYETSLSHVYDVASGRKFNLEIAEALLQIAKSGEKRALKLSRNLAFFLENRKPAPLKNS